MGAGSLNVSRWCYNIQQTMKCLCVHIGNLVKPVKTEADNIYASFSNLSIHSKTLMFVAPSRPPALKKSCRFFSKASSMSCWLLHLVWDECEKHTQSRPSQQKAFPVVSIETSKPAYCDICTGQSYGHTCDVTLGGDWALIRVSDKCEKLSHSGGKQNGGQELGRGSCHAVALLWGFKMFSLDKKKEWSN